MSAQVFDRWKYAEEEAGRLIKAGRLIRLTIRPDVSHEDDGEAYVYDDFVLEDLGDRSDPGVEVAALTRRLENSLDLVRFRKALEEIVACDYRGNMPPEQEIARKALRRWA